MEKRMRHTVIALILVIGLPQACLAQASGQFPCDAFRKDEQGAWSAIRTVTIQVPNGSITVGPGSKFRGNAINVNGVDFTAMLEANCRK